MTHSFSQLPIKIRERPTFFKKPKELAYFNSPSTDALTECHLKEPLIRISNIQQ